MTMIKSAEDFRAGPPPQELMEAIGRLGAEAAQAGAMVEMGGLLPSAAGARIKLSRGKVTVLDGPFTEAKEVVGGYAIFETKSKDEAIAWSRRLLELHERHWPAWEGEIEIRQFVDGPPPCSQQ
jgi:hypothetical protein